MKQSCNISGKKILAIKNLKQHQDRVHKKKGFKCTKCDHRVKIRSSLSHLIRVIHDGVDYQCRQFDHKANLKVHLAEHKRAVHEGVKYPCGQCDHTATSKGSLAQHKKQQMKA